MQHRVKPRFFVFLTLLLCIIAFLIYKLTVRTTKLDYIFSMDSDYSQTMSCVVIRDEAVTASPNVVRTQYLAAEDSYVYEGDTVCNLFSTGYTESLLNKLESTRESIQEYHKTLLGTIIDSSLDRLDGIVGMTAEEFRNVANGTTQGNLRFTISQLETAMENRQEYLRQNKRDDSKLTKLYEEENSRLTAIQAWQTVSKAPKSGVLSFYLDGYENDLTPALLEHLTIADIETVLRGGELATTEDTLLSGVYRIVDQNKWYTAVISDSDSWNPVIGQSYYMQIEGFDDLVFTATVTNAQKNSGKLLAIFEIDEPIGPVIYTRGGRATLSITMTSLAVRAEALDVINGETGVWLYDGTAQGTFVPVQVISRDGDNAMIRPTVEGALDSGRQILIK